MPFIQTALIHDGDENIIHIGALRVRVNGTGVLRTTLYSLDGIESQSLANITMASTSSIEPTILANFNSQRIMVKLYTDNISEIIDINRIIVYIKPLWSEFPR